MQSNLNDQFISEYGTRFSEGVISSIDVDKSTITGKEIVSLTSSKQVNFFILKSLYTRWQEEMKKLESPYFDYKNEDVRKALTNYMNVLSQHIAVETTDLKPLLEEAIKRTIYWILTPGEALREEVEQKSIKLVSGIKTLSRYFKVYQEDLAYLLDEKQNVSIEDFLAEWDQLISQKSVDSIIEKELTALSDVVEISIDDCIIQEDVEEEVFVESEMPVEEEESDAVTEPEDTGGDEEEAPDEVASQVDDTHTESKIDPGLARDTESEPVSITNDDDYDTEAESATETKEKSDSDPLSDKDSFEEEEQIVETDDSLNKKFEKNQETLHDQYKKEEVSVAIKHQQKKISSILEAISVNQEFMFTSELFGGEKAVFLEAVEKIETCSSFDESVELLVSSYSAKYDWDMNSVEVKELLKVVFRRFR